MGDLLSLIAAIYDAGYEPVQWPLALTEIARYFGGVGAILTWRKDDRTLGAILSGNMGNARGDQEAPDLVAKDKVRIAEPMLFINAEPLACRHVRSGKDSRTDLPYEQFIVENGLGSFGGIVLSSDPQTRVFLGVQRGSGAESDYSDAELSLLSLLGQHVERSLRLSIQSLDARLASLGLGEALTRVGVGAFALDAQARVVFANPTGERLVGDVIEYVDGRLLLRSTASTRHAFDEALSREVRGESAEFVEAPRPIPFLTDGGRRFVAYVLKPGTLVEHFLVRPQAIVLIIEQKADGPADPLVVRDLLQLTLGEAKVAALVGSGFSPRKAAERLGIAEDTARNVLKRVFAKVGVSRQSELSVLLSRLLLR